MKAKKIVRSALLAQPLLLVPLIAMQFTNKVDWDGRDFILAGILLAGVGVAIQMIVSGVRNNPRQAILGLALFAVALLIWAELALGVFGSPFAGS